METPVSCVSSSRRLSMSLLWLGDPKSFDVALVGGKAANLSRLARMYHRVPDGFCIPVTVMDEAHPRDLRDEIAQAISDLMACHNLPELVVAVRSSAVDEDGTAASFAGQHETFLNIVGVDSIMHAVTRCWESARSERALDYRRKQGLSGECVQLAVHVQQLVASDVSAVVFSANPITGSRDEIMINASWGLGESIVGCKVTPDTFIVRKSDLVITSRTVADKQRMTVSVPGGTCEVDVPRFLRTQVALNDAQAIEMAQLALTLDATLHCRPITTLK